MEVQSIMKHGRQPQFPLGKTSSLEHGLWTFPSCPHQWPMNLMSRATHYRMAAAYRLNISTMCGISGSIPRKSQIQFHRTFRSPVRGTMHKTNCQLAEGSCSSPIIPKCPVELN